VKRKQDARYQSVAQGARRSGEARAMPSIGISYREFNSRLPARSALLPAEASQ
jgi:hypothetical protein